MTDTAFYTDSILPISRDQTRRRGPSIPERGRFNLRSCGVLDALGSQNKCNTCYGVVAMGQVYGQLSLEERIELYRRRRGGDSLLEIARRLGRHVSTISRELKRNSLATKAWSNGYCPVRAQQLTERRRRWDGRFKLARQPDLQNLVKDRLAMRHSPEQIAGRLTLEHGHTVISHESIHRFAYHRSAQKDYCYRKYRRGRLGNRGGSAASAIKFRRSISDRAIDVADRGTPGHWE